MAGETPPRKLDQVPLLTVNVMACEATHLRGTVASAAFQQCHLVAMNVHRRDGCLRRGIQIVAESLPGGGLERWGSRLAEPTLAPRARPPLPLPPGPRPGDQPP